MSSTLYAIAPASLSGMTRLEDWGVIRARGAEAGSFLQSQLTNDVQSLSEGSARLAGYCSAKGRLLATFVVWRAGADEWLLACSTDLLPPVLKRLSMFVLRAKCKLSDASAEVPLWGLAGEVIAGPMAAAGLVLPAAPWSRVSGPAGQAIRLPAARIEGQWVPRVLFAAAQAPAWNALEASAWAWLEVMSGTPRIVAATVEQFVPQMVNLELVGGVNFQKGCYPGQEVVARSQYRGTLKRRGFILVADEGAAPGQEIYSESDPGQPCGLVVLAASHGGQHAVLAEMKLAAAHSDAALHLRAADGPRLHLAILPYDIPAEAE